MPRFERPFWVVEQLEVATFEGLRCRFRAWRTSRKYREKRRPTSAAGFSGAPVFYPEGNLAALVTIDGNTRLVAIREVVAQLSADTHYRIGSGLSLPPSKEFRAKKE